MGKLSENNQIKTYFEEVLRLTDSGEEFPVDLDEVWEIAYSGKDKAVRVLLKEFLQGIDYQVSTINGENPMGGRPVTKYKLSSACLEHLIARKVTPVFEVYRKVFHQTRKAIQQQFQVPTDFASALQLAADLQKSVDAIKPKADYHDEFIGNREGLYTTSDISKAYGISAMKLNVNC